METLYENNQPEQKENIKKPELHTQEVVFNPENEVIIVKKLVRDKSIEILKKNGVDCKYKNIKNTRFKYALFRKLVEESTECANASEANFRIELADILTVFLNITSILKIDLADWSKNTYAKKPRSMVSISKEYLLQMGGKENVSQTDVKEKLGEFWNSFSYTLTNNGISIAEIGKIAEKKEKERGSFSNNIFLIEISAPASNPIIQKYLKTYRKKMAKKEEETTHINKEEITNTNSIEVDVENTQNQQS